jgi:excisionase family DNA binding protein
MEIEKQNYSIEEFAKLLNYSGRTVRDMCKNGEIEANKIGSHRKWQIPVSELGRLKSKINVNRAVLQKDNPVQATTVAPDVSRKMSEADIVHAKDKHWDDLTLAASQILGFYDDYSCCHPPNGYDGYIIDDPKYDLIDRCLYSSLLAHLSSEFSEYSHLTDWHSLISVKPPEGLIDKLFDIAHRQPFFGRCDICKDWA